MTFDFHLGPDALNGVVEAITDRTLIIPLLEIDGNSQLAFLELNSHGIIANGTVMIAAEFVFLGAYLGSLWLGLGHCAHGLRETRACLSHRIVGRRPVLFLAIH